MSKYYIPKLSEFHIGFRFEQNEDYKLDNWDFWEESFNKNLCKFKEGESLWSKSTFGEQDKENGRIGFYGMLSQTPMGTGRSAFNEMENFRVKYLDQQDIEELGWKTMNSANFYILQIGQGEAFYLYRDNPTSNLWDISYKDHTDEEIINEYRFRGEVKNYNELFRLMKMLKI